jgi:hypothetical protein
MECFVERVFWKMFEAVEQVTSRNRQLGKFHGNDSRGLLRQVTSATVRTMKARLVEGGLEALELWCPDFSLLGATTRRPKRENGGSRAPMTTAGGYPCRKLPCDRTGFAKMLRSDAPELDRDLWLERILGASQYKDDPERLYLDCGRALSDLPMRRERNLERLLGGNNGKA